MNAKAIRVSLLFFLLLSVYSIASAQQEAGLRLGKSLGKDDPDLYEIYGVWLLPYQLQWSSDWHLQLALEASAGVLGKNDYGGVFAAGPRIDFTTASGNFNVSYGSKPSLLSRYRFNDKDLGGDLQFTNFIEIGYQLSKAWRIGYRYMHISNAGLESPNPGLDVHAFQLGYRN